MLYNGFLAYSVVSFHRLAIRVPGFGSMEINLEPLCECQCAANQVSNLLLQASVWLRHIVCLHIWSKINMLRVKPYLKHFKASTFISLSVMTLLTLCNVVSRLHCPVGIFTGTEQQLV